MFCSDDEVKEVQLTWDKIDEIKDMNVEEYSLVVVFWKGRSRHMMKRKPVFGSVRHTKEGA